MRSSFLLLIAAAGFLTAGVGPSAGAAVANDGYLTYGGIARGRRANEFLYGERHFLRYANGEVAERVVLYTCRDGSAFARKSVAYVDRTAPDFLLENVLDGMREGIRDSGDAERTVFFRAHGGDPEKTGPMPRIAGLVADAGFDEYVQSHWRELMSGAPLVMRFLVPGHLTDYGFQVQHLRRETVLGVSTEVFRLRLAGFWGWFLPGIDVYYDAASRVLVRYDGLSDLRDAAGDNYKVLIDFTESERKPSTAEAMRAARAASLAPCR